MLVGALEDAFQDGDVGDLAAGGEGLVAGEDQVVAVLGDDDVVVARVDGAAEEPAVACGLGFDVLPLLAGADQAGGPVPQVVVAEELADGAVGLGDFTYDAVGGGPVLSPAAVLGGPEEGDQAGVLQEPDLRVRGGAGAVALDGVGGQDGGDLGGAGDPLGGGGGGGAGLPVGGRGGAHGRTASFAVRGAATGAGAGQAETGTEAGRAPPSGSWASSSRTRGSTRRPKYSTSSR
ncbi:hypothetical protein GCM10010389_39590 [Streptomyces echinoruber]|uniref:Uncharacterized protein n=1 Tax=Streptomyces echinoruber TaxID=68898 RepID=A0A918RG04_9ACTN|nr:hypothetical protein GCM10010389_39590 [Streptomyces echinoruber]